MAEALPLLALLQQASCGHDEDGVDADHAEDGGEDVVDQDVGEGGDGGRTGAHERSGGGAGADVIGDEGGRGAVEVATALELLSLLVGILHDGLEGWDKHTADCMSSWISGLCRK